MARTSSYLWFGLMAAVSCGDGALETVTTVQGICTLDSRLAVLVTIDNPDDLEIDSVTATRADEQHCFLETRPRERPWEDAGAPVDALYSCWEQGTGTYLVRVTSGQQAWSERVDVPGNDCHVTKTQHLTIALE